MMTRALLKIAVPAVVILTLLAALPRARTADLRDVQAFLLPQSCRPPCWEGIRPGVTSDSGLFQLLPDHHWVAETDRREYDGFSGFVTWRWSSERPAWVGLPGPDYIFVEQNTVSQISLGTALLYGDIWQILGRPDWANSFQADDDLRLNIAYRQPGLMVILDVKCGGGVSGLWQANATLIWPIFVSESGEIMQPTPRQLAACEV